MLTARDRGVILPPGATRVLIEGRPAARLGDLVDVPGGPAVPIVEGCPVVDGGDGRALIVGVAIQRAASCAPGRRAVDRATGRAQPGLAPELGRGGTGRTAAVTVG